MKKKAVLGIVCGSLILGFSLVGCGPKSDPTPTLPFNFEIALQSGTFNGQLYMGKNDQIRVYESGTIEGKERDYTYSVAAGGEKYVSINKYSGLITPIAVTPEGQGAIIRVTENNYEPTITKSIPVVVSEVPTPKTAGANYASNPEARTEILGKLEEYTMENMLGGITLFEQGAYVRYSPRVKVKATECITGYGWGVLTEGEIDGYISREIPHPEYYQTASANDPLTINAWDATGSQVGDLNGYITSSYWGTRMVGTTDYEWYPVLAADTYMDGNKEVPFTRPIALEDPNPLEMYKKWRIYVKTGEEDDIYNLQYKTLSNVRKSYNGRPIKVEDYEFAFQMLLSENSKVMRGAELAGDTTYGIKGGQTFYNLTKGIKDSREESTLDAYWKSLKEDGTLGIDSGYDNDAKRYYIDLELVNAIDSFTAMYVLSSSLYSPIPKDFLRDLGNGDYTAGAVEYGTFSTKTGAPDPTTAIMDNTLCVGPYYLEEWQKNKITVFARNNDWFEVGEGKDRYKIPGVVINIVTGATEDEELLFRMFEANTLDQVSLPKGKMSEYDPQKDRVVKGDSTFKLNVNSCSQERWNELNEELWHNDVTYPVKPAMSNNNFLKGLYWSINRKNFATSRGATPSINYFGASYMSDPEEGTSYNDTDAHLNAVRNFHNGVGVNDDYGYNVTTARKYFAMACDELSRSGQLVYGTPSNPAIISIDIEWMYTSDIEDYGKEIEKYFTDAFNHESVCGNRVKLVINQGAVTLWSDVYDKYLQIGKFDLAFGAISGNSFNPLNFMEVLKSDNSSQFTLNWGPDTSKVDEKNPIVYDGVSWSYDALWAAGDHGAVIKNGENVDPVEKGNLADVAGIPQGNIFNGGNFSIDFKFVKDVELVVLEVTRVKLFLAYASSIDLTYTVDPDSGKMLFYISPEQGKTYDDAMFNGDKALQRAYEAAIAGGDEAAAFNARHPFRLDLYNARWQIQVYYTLRIAGGSISENVYEVKFSQTDKSLVRFANPR